MKRLRFLYLLSLTLVFTGCYKEKFESIPHGYYTLEYENHAWGHQHSGWILDTDGKVKEFNLPENWNTPDSLGYLTENEIIENISYCKNEIDKFSKRKMYKFNKKIQNAANGNITSKKNTANDAGQTEYYCFFYDENKNAYKKINLSTEGDFSYHNESDEAKEIVDWLKKIK